MCRALSGAPYSRDPKTLRAASSAVRGGAEFVSKDCERGCAAAEVSFLGLRPGFFFVRGFGASEVSVLLLVGGSSGFSSKGYGDGTFKTDS
jgi:hypothetical protein